MIEANVYNINQIVLENGVHNEQGEMVVIDFPLTIIGESKDGCIIIGGLTMEGEQEDDVNVKNLTISQSKGAGVHGGRGMSFHLFNLNIEKSKYHGVYVMSSVRNTMSNCQVSHSKLQGVHVQYGGLMTIIGSGTSINNNVTGGLFTCSSRWDCSCIHLVSPLIIENISSNNGGGGNYGGGGTIDVVDNEGGLIETIQEAVFGDDY